MEDFSRRKMQDMLLCLQLWANDKFENSWRGTMLLAIASMLECFLIGLDD
jgi:hypothetical protein